MDLIVKEEELFTYIYSSFSFDMKPVHLTHIRSNRPKKGLMPQHFTALKAVAQLTRASHKGFKIGSTEIHLIQMIFKAANIIWIYVQLVV